MVTTNALEVGIDIPDLDVVLLLGMPSSLASLYQQIGRVARDQSKSTLVMMLLQPEVYSMDRYVSEHFREVLLDRSVVCESAGTVHVWNPHIHRLHCVWACKECPLKGKGEPGFSEVQVDALVREGKLVRENG